jgi:hypothetical protein
VSTVVGLGVKAEVNKSKTDISAIIPIVLERVT